MVDSTPLPTTDQPATTADKTLTGILKDAVPIAEAAILATQPWLGLPVVKQLWEALFSYLVGQLSGALGLLTGYVVMDVQKAYALQNAAQALVELREAQRNGDINAVTQANAKMDSAVAPILHYVGSIQH